MIAEGAITYEVTFDRIGRGARGAVERFTVNGGRDHPDHADHLAAEVWGYVGRFLMSSDYVVTVDLEKVGDPPGGTGSIDGGRFGTFTFEEVAT